MADPKTRLQLRRSLTPSAAAPTAMYEGELSVNIPDKKLYVGPAGGGTGVLLVHKTPVFDVRYYGAYGDGSTDDTNAFNLAVAALEAEGGGCLHIPAGTYRLTDTITVSAVPLLLTGCGAASVMVWDASHNDAGWYFALCPYVWMMDCVLVSKCANVSVSYFAGRPAINIDAYTVDAGDPSVSGRMRYMFERLEIRAADDWIGGWNIGIRANECDNLRVHGCRIAGWSDGAVDPNGVTKPSMSCGIALGGSGQSWRPILTDNHISDALFGIYLRDRVDVVIATGNIIQQTFNAFRMDEALSAPETEASLTLKGNIMQSYYQVVYIERVNNVLIEGNQFYRAVDCAHDAYRAVLLMTICNGGVVSDNWMENLRPDHTFGARTEAGGGVVFTNNMQQFTISNNRFRNLYCGVHLNSGTSNNLVENNIGQAVDYDYIDESDYNIKANASKCVTYLKDVWHVDNGAVNETIVWDGFIRNTCKFVAGDAGGTSSLGASVIIPAGVSKVDVKLFLITDNIGSADDLLQPYVDLFPLGAPTNFFRLGVANAQKYLRGKDQIFSLVVEMDISGVDVQEGDELVARYSAFATAKGFDILQTVGTIPGGSSGVAGWRSYMSVTVVR